MQGFFLENHYTFDSSHPERSKHSLVPTEQHSREVISHLLGSRACVGHHCLALHQHSETSHKPQLNGPCLAWGMQDPTLGRTLSVLGQRVWGLLSASPAQGGDFSVFLPRTLAADSQFCVFPLPGCCEGVVYVLGAQAVGLAPLGISSPVFSAEG